jgi:hypothetical protein
VSIVIKIARIHHLPSTAHTNHSSRSGPTRCPKSLTYIRYGYSNRACGKIN